MSEEAKLRVTLDAQNKGQDEVDKFEESLKGVGDEAQKAHEELVKTFSIDELVNDAVSGLDVANEAMDQQEAAVHRLALAQHDLESRALDLADAERALANNTDPEAQHELKSAVLKARVALDAQNETVTKLAREHIELGDRTEKSAGAFRQLSDAFESVTGVSLATALSVGAVFGAVKEGYAIVQQAAEWGDSMGDLAQLTGDTVENTSRLATVWEFAGGKAEDLTRVVKAMNAEGLSLNLSTVIDLNRQYNAIQDPVERNTFLFRNFGKSAADMAELMGRSEAQLRGLAEAADKSGKVIGEEAAEQAEKFNTQMAIFNKQVEGAKISVGGFAIDLSQKLARGLRDGTNDAARFLDSISELNSPMGQFAYQLIVSSTGLREYANAFDVATKASDGLTGEIDDGTRAADAWSARWAGVADEALAVKALEDAKLAAQDYNNELLILDAALSGDLSAAQQEFYDNNKDISASIVETQDKIKELEALPYLTDDQRQQLDDLKTTLGEQRDELDKNRDKWESTTNAILFDMIRQAYAADGMSFEEIASLGELGVALGQYDQKTGDTMASVLASVQNDGLLTREELQRILDKYTEFELKPDIEKHINIITNRQALERTMTQYGSEDAGTTVVITPSDDNTTLTGAVPGLASGGTFIVPGSGRGDRPYTVPLEPGERVTVTPVDKVGRDGIAQTVDQGRPPINLYAFVVDDADMEKLAYKLVNIIANRT